MPNSTLDETHEIQADGAEPSVAPADEDAHSIATSIIPAVGTE